MQKDFVISDIHGCYKTFRCLLEEILQPTLSDHIYLLGDYINKGPSSKAVIDFILELKNKGFKIFPLMGNHEKLMLDAMDDPAQFHTFIEKGGAATLKDFGVDKISDIPLKYIDFLSTLEYYIEKDDWLLVHAGFNFREKDPFKDSDAMLNARRISFVPTLLRGRRIIHGHVPVTLPTIMNQLRNPNHWNYYLDGGCVYPFRDGMGFLVAMELHKKQLFIKECIDEVE